MQLIRHLKDSVVVEHAAERSIGRMSTEYLDDNPRDCRQNKLNEPRNKRQSVD